MTVIKYGNILHAQLYSTQCYNKSGPQEHL